MNASPSTRSWIVKFTILGAIVVSMLFGVAWLAIRICCPAFLVSSASMENTLLPGDAILVNRLATWRGHLPGRDQLVVFHYPPDRTQVFVERIVGVAGDRLKMRDGKLYRNGIEVVEPYVWHASASRDSYRDNFPAPPNSPLREQALDMLEHHVFEGEVRVPEGCYFAMGDNRDDSADSRYFGFVGRGDIIGRPFLIYLARDPKRAWKALR